MATRKKLTKPKTRKTTRARKPALSRLPLPKPPREYPTVINAVNRLNVLCAAWSQESHTNSTHIIMTTLATTENVVRALLPQLKHVAAILTSMEKRLDTLEDAVGSKPPPQTSKDYLRVLETPFRPHPPHTSPLQAGSSVPTQENPALDRRVDSVVWPSGRARRVVLETKAVTIRDLVRMTELDLYHHVKGGGPKTRGEIQAKLKSMGLSLGMRFPHPSPAPAPSSKLPGDMTVDEVREACRRGEQNCHVCFDFACGDNANPLKHHFPSRVKSSHGREKPLGPLTVAVVTSDQQPRKPEPPFPHDGEPCKTPDGEACERHPLPPEVQDVVNDVSSSFARACREMGKTFSEASARKPYTPPVAESKAPPPDEDVPAPLFIAKCDCGKPATMYWACKAVCSDCRAKLATPLTDDTDNGDKSA